MSRPTYLTIDLNALKYNLERVRAFAPKTSIIAMVKANAYGHGIVSVAQALSSAESLGVASLEEGVKCREAGIKQPIVLIEGLFQIEEIIEAAKHDFTLVVHHNEHVEMLKDAKIEKPFSIWLKINTGMNRLGIPPNDIKQVYQQLLNLSSVKKPIGLMTHFSEADLIEHATTLEQIKCFDMCTAGLSGPKSLANSAAIIAWPQSHADWVRPGLMLYGASPFSNKTGDADGLKPVMTLSSRLIAVNVVTKGSKVGYGGVWTAPKEMKIGVVGVGYGDGYPQFAENGTPVLVQGKECQLAGRVSMDMLTVDLSNAPEAKIGDEVILWGKGLAVERVAKYSKTSAYEILTRMTPRPKVQILDFKNEQKYKEETVFTV